MSKLRALTLVSLLTVVVAVGCSSSNQGDIDKAVNATLAAAQPATATSTAISTPESKLPSLVVESRNCSTNSDVGFAYMEGLVRNNTSSRLQNVLAVVSWFDDRANTRNPYWSLVARFSFKFGSRNTRTYSRNLHSRGKFDLSVALQNAS